MSAENITSTSTDPMECVDDAICLVDQARGICDLLTEVDPEGLKTGTVAKAAYALETLLEGAFERLSRAKR